MYDTKLIARLKILNKFLLLVSGISGFLVGFTFMLAFNFEIIDCLILGLLGSVVSCVVAQFIVTFSMVVIQFFENVIINIIGLKQQTEALRRIIEKSYCDKADIDF